MKKFTLLGLLSLLVLTLHAKEMSVRIVDAFGDPVSGITGYIIESNSSWNPDYSRFTTDNSGEFTVERTNMNFMRLHIDDYYDWDLPQDYEVVWDGSDKPVVIKMDGFCRFIFKLIDVSTSEYNQISIDTYDEQGQIKNLPIEWNIDGRDTAWVAIDTTTQILNWALGGKILFAPQNQVKNISDPKNREITINAPLTGMQKLTLGILGKDGTGISGSIHMNKLQVVGVYENINISNASSEGLYQYYIPEGEYTIQLTDCSSNYILPATQTISIGEDVAKTVFDFSKSYQAKITVYDLDENPIPDATLYMINSSQYIHTDDQGCAIVYALPGEYVYDVRVWEPDFMIYNNLQLDIDDSDIEKSIHFSDVYTIFKVDVKLRPDMQRDLLQVALNGTTIPYDDVTGLYTIKSSKKDVQCTFYYPGTFSDWIDIDSVKETPEVFSYEEYRKISILPEDTSKYRLDNIRIEMEGLYNTIHANATQYLYLIDSNYVATVDVYDKMTQISYKNEKIEFTVDGEDKNIQYTFDASKFHDVTFKLVAPDASPIQGQQIIITPASGGSNIYTNLTDATGAVTIKLPQGRYTYTLYANNSYPSRYGELIINEKDIEIVLSYEGYKKINACAIGDLLSDINIISISLQNSNANFSLSLIDWNNYTDSCYVPAGEYTCSYSVTTGDGSSGAGKFIFYNTRLSVNKDTSIDLDLSSDIFKKIIFDVVDEKGYPLYGPDNFNTENIFKIESENGSTEFYSSLPKYFYLKDGQYKAGIMKSFDADWQITPFSVENDDRIKVVYKTPREFTLTFNVEGVTPSKELNIKIMSNSSDSFRPLILTLTADSQGKAQGNIKLQEGDDYNYSIAPYNNIVKKFSIHEDMVITADVSGLREVTIYFKNEKGEFINLADENAYCLLYHNNTVFDSDDRSYYNGYLMAGETYKVCASCYGYNTTIKDITIGTETNQTFDIILSESVSDVYVLLMYPNIDIETTAGTLTLDNECVALVDRDGYLMIGDVTPGEHQYTIELEGYESISGTIMVSSETAYEGIWVEVEYPIGQSTSINEISENEDTSINFIAYFSSGDKSIHIKRKSYVSGEWNVRVVSASAVTAYQSVVYPEAEEIVIPADHLSKGLYLIILDNGQERCINKLIVE